MSGIETTNEQGLRGLLECPLRKGFIEFQFVPGDLVRDLKHQMQTVWGAPTKRLDPRWNVGFMYQGAGFWAIFCEAPDGAYERLRDSDMIPALPPPRETQPKRERWFGIVPGSAVWPGYVHESDLNIRLSLVFDHQPEALQGGPFAVKLVALAAITGG